MVRVVVPVVVVVAVAWAPSEPREPKLALAPGPLFLTFRLWSVSPRDDDAAGVAAALRFKSRLVSIRPMVADE